MTTQELEILANKIVSGLSVSASEYDQFIEECSRFIKDAEIVLAS